MSDRLSVMFFLPQLGGGGAEMNAVRLASGLLAAAITPMYAVARGPGSYAELLPECVEVEVLNTGCIDSSTLRLIRSSGPLSRLIDAKRPDVLCPVMVTPALAALSALRRSKHQPVIVPSIQNSLDFSHLQHPGLLQRIETRLIKRKFPALDGVITLSRGVATELAQIVPALANRIKTIPNVGLPLPAQMANAMKIDRTQNERQCTILACGRLTKQKDYPTLLRAFARLSGVGLRLQILGDGHLRQELFHLSQQLNIDERVDFLGFQRDPYTYMRRADIFVLASRWEGFGNVLVEAMSMGTPVVSTNCPHGPSEIIDDGRTGLLVPTEDPASLAYALQSLIDNPELRLRLGQAAQSRAQDFAASQICTTYAEYFRTVAAGGILRKYTT